jgi:hypothetical protein
VKTIKFKNFSQRMVFVSCTSGRSARFEAGQCREVHEGLMEACLNKRLVPMDDIEATMRREEDEATASAEAEAEAKVAEYRASEARAKALADASAEADEEIHREKAALLVAKKSESAKKAAATRAANKAAVEAKEA